MGEGKEKELQEHVAAESTSSSGEEKSLGHRVFIWLVFSAEQAGSLTMFVSEAISNGVSVHMRLSR